MVIARLTRGSVLNYRAWFNISHVMVSTVRCCQSCTLMILDTADLDKIARLNKELSQSFLKYINILEKNDQIFDTDYLPPTSTGNFNALRRKQALQNVVVNIIMANRERN